MCKVNDDANEISELYFQKVYENLIVDNEIQKELEKTYGLDADDSDEEADDGKQRQEYAEVQSKVDILTETKDEFK